MQVSSLFTQDAGVYSLNVSRFTFRLTRVCVLSVSQIQSCQMLLNQLREITGIQDPSFLHEALKVSLKASIQQVLKLLFIS